MPEGIGYGDDAIEKLIELATDPMYDSADPTLIGALQGGVPQPGTASPTMGYRVNPSYAAGGMVTPSGPPAGLSPRGAPQMDMRSMEAEMQRIIQQNPERVLQIKQAMEGMLQSGELTAQELNMAVQLATAAAQNPQLWPQLRAFAIQQGLASEQELPAEYDQGLVFVILLAARATQGGGTPQSQGQPAQAAMADGGAVPDSRNPDGSVAINAHEGEVVLHAGVVKAEGLNKLNALNAKYNLDGSLKQTDAKTSA